MKLEKIKIKNFGIFIEEKEIPIKGKIASIIGENGTGKSSILLVIKLLLDRTYRRSGVSIEWIPNENEETYFEYTFDSKGFEKMGVVLPIEEKSEIKIKVVLELDKELNKFYPIIYIGDIEKLKYSYTQKLPFDDFIEIIHITPNLENKINKWIDSNFKEAEVLSKINEEINLANNKIFDIKPIKVFNKKLNEDINSIMKKTNFLASLESNIQLTQVGKALNIFPKNKDKRIITHGDGFNKIISIMSNIKQSNDNKMKILIMDELENNFFYTYQSQIIEFLKKEICNDNLAQIILTTHSPNVIKISPGSSITKLMFNSDIKSFHFNEEKQDEYYQKNLSTAIFYEKILFVEGHSEKMFFEYLFKNNEALRKILNNHSEIHIMNNQGVDFIKTMLFLKEMTSKIVILTDNDVWEKKNGIPQYFGLQRIWKLSCELVGSDKIEKNKYKSFEKKDITSEDKNYIINLGIQNNIFTQKNTGKTFEDSLLEEGLIKEEEMKELRKAKLKNLSKFIKNISDNLVEKQIKDSEYLFKWIGVMKND